MVDRDNIGTHTMRKTFGYFHYKRNKDVATLQQVFSHSSPTITKQYIGLTQEELDDSIDFVLYTNVAGGERNFTMSPLNEHTPIKGTTHQIVDYWKWAYSNINMNSERGIFAEFLVGSALGALNQGRVEWDIADLHYKGKQIEVKSSAFVQEWEQKKPSIPSFDIAKKYKFGEYTTRDRYANLYAFALLFEQTRSVLDPLNMEQWEFYIMSTEDINGMFGDQKRISLNPLKKVCKAVPYNKIKQTVDEILQQIE